MILPYRTRTIGKKMPLIKLLSLLAAGAVSLYAEVRINELCALNGSRFNDDFSSTPDWVELHNTAGTPADISGYRLSDDIAKPDKFTFPANSAIPENGFLKIWITDSFTGFELSGKGEQIILSKTDGAVADSLTFPGQLEDISYGRSKDAPDTFLYFAEPTPGGPNDTHGYRMVETAITFSPEPGFYSDAKTVVITSENGRVRYTTDGTLPGEASPEVPENGIPVDKTCVIRARVLDEEAIGSVVETKTYFIDEHSHGLPVFSITANPVRLFNKQVGPTGYAVGLYDNFNGNGNTVTGDIRATVQMFDTGGACVINQEADIKSFGMGSNAYAQKSLALYAKSSYGENDFNYAMFPNKPITKTKRFILRNSGNDNGSTLFRDALIHLLMKDHADVDFQDYQPALLFINGTCFGIQNIREKADKHYPDNNYGYDDSEIDMLRGYGGAKLSEVIAGDDAHFKAIDAYIADNDISVSENYAYVKKSIDIECFMDYLITQLYIANMDFMTNVKEWRPKTGNGRWRWILFDTDAGFGLLATDGFYEHNSFENFSRRFCPVWRKKFLENSEYRAMLLHRFATHINTTFKPARVRAKIDEIAERLKPVMPNHIERWKDEAVAPGFTSIGTMDAWERNIDSLKLFAVNRPEYFYRHMKAYYSLSSTVNVAIVNGSPGGGAIRVAGIRLNADTLSGKYFTDVPLTIEAVPGNGYKFDKWSNGDGHPEISVTLVSDTTLAVNFVRSNGIVRSNAKATAPGLTLCRRSNTILLQGINAGGSTGTVVSLMELNGRVLIKKRIPAAKGECLIDLNTISGGIHLLSVSGGNQVARYMIAVDR